MSSLGIVITKAKTIAGVTALTTKARIYPVQLPQTATLPCLVLNIVGDQDRPYLTGAAGMWTAVVTVECIGATPDQIMELGDALRTGLHGIGKETIAGHTDVSILHAGIDFTDPVDDRSAFRRTIDFRVFYK